MNTTIKKYASFFVFAAAMMGMVSCQPDETDLGNGLASTNDPSFTITPNPSSVYKFTLQATNENYLSSKWIIDGIPAVDELGKPKEIFLPDAGDYVITHAVTGIGGVETTDSKNINISVSDPVAGNRVIDGRFPQGKGQWQVLDISASGASWTFATGSATIKGGGGNQQGIYQPITIEAGKKYMVDMAVSGSGATDTWFEVYVSKTAPVQGNDFSGTDGDKRISLNTWAGCGKTPFNGKLSEISCSGSGSRFQFDEGGTVYLVIKAGGQNLGTTGITIKNVELRGVVE